MVEQPDAHGKERGVDTRLQCCALSAGQIINRALILGFTCTPYKDPFFPTCRWLASISPKGTQYVAETIEMCAFRWLQGVHPEVHNDGVV